MATPESNEKLLALQGGRTLAYADYGNSSSSTVIIFFHGAFFVGDASRTSPILLQKGVHCITPTLPGWGNTSPVPPSTSYVSCLLSDVTFILQHLHPNDPNLRIFVAGGSFGTVPAQMVFGAPYDVLPLGRHIVGLLLLGTFSPFHYHEDYTKGLTWPDYISVGPPSQYIPLKLIPNLLKLFIQPKLKSVESTERFFRSLMMDKMKPSEKAKFEEWRVKQGLEEGQFERKWATIMNFSVSKSWEGFLGMADVLHSDWGFDPSELDEEHKRRRVLIVGGTDDQLSPTMAQWLVERYGSNAKLVMKEGGHLSSMFYMDEIWGELLGDVESTVAPE
ncbi:hypothetical protein JAAARDRAFT_167303 [Jaapia argillacea MUCL 33604]|uniref:AB hydrolase-1 domain-containing protein n=1 Tax=Jaapia argillacea MUCL 33604 TaxID=933084 RepID=A0A067QMG6_9AGAM|nr:hypothetical protein JAAARDRAFT_167303 [Jaapia argillacea MUCL 33604]